MANAEREPKSDGAVLDVTVYPWCNLPSLCDPWPPDKHSEWGVSVNIYINDWYNWISFLLFRDGMNINRRLDAFVLHESGLFTFREHSVKFLLGISHFKNFFNSSYLFPIYLLWHQFLFKILANQSILLKITITNKYRDYWHSLNSLFINILFGVSHISWN